MHHETWLKDVLVFLVAAGLIVPLFHRARFGAVLGFLLIGIAVGPSGFGAMSADFPWLRYLTIENRARVEPFAELGVMFLLFLIGIEMSTERLWSLRRYVAGIGSLQFLLSAIAFGVVLSLLGASGSAAIILGLGLAMSSTAVVLQLLEDQGRTATPLGQVAIAVLLFQDLMVAPVLFGVEILARGGDVLWGLAEAVLKAAVAIVAILVIGRFLLRPLFGIAARTASRELIMAMSLLLVISVATVTGYAGLSTALGAFLAGVLLSETEYRHQVEVDLAPFKGLLVGLFFITVGMSIDLRTVWDAIGAVLLAVATLLAIKALIVLAVSRICGVTPGVATEAAILLAQAGEFAFIVIGLGRYAGLLTADLAQMAAAIVGISMLLTPLLAIGARLVAGWIEAIEHRDRMPSDHLAQARDHVIIGGYGRVGQLIAQLLRAENVPYVALDVNPRRVRGTTRGDHDVFFGDAGRREFLRRAGAARARAFVVTVNSPRAAERMVVAAHQEQPGAPVFARARDAEHAARLLRLGAADVMPEAIEASLQLGARLLKTLGVPDEAIARRLEEVRLDEVQLAERATHGGAGHASHAAGARRAGNDRDRRSAAS
ncbi:MAG: cation:proton antiporter [Hyphomicrobiales bacterium]|nr:cation:proton antiporter [Hyphomicrobiales bacterium]